MPQSPEPSDLLAAIDEAGIGYGLLDSQGRVRYMAPATRQLLDLDPEADFTGRVWHDLDLGNSQLRQLRREEFARLIASGVTWHGIVRWKTTEEGLRYFDCTAKRLDEDQVLVFLTDRTEQFIAAKRIAAREQLVSKTLDQLPALIMLQSADQKILYTNKRLDDYYGIAQGSLAGQVPAAVEGLKHRRHVQPLVDAVIQSGLPVRLRRTTVNEGPHAGSHWLIDVIPLEDDDGITSQFLTIERDVTERTTLERDRRLYQKKLFELQKMQALNRFAGSLAHELSNILHPAGVYARALTANPGQPDRDRLLMRINEAVLEAGDILRQTLAMTRSERDGAGPVELQELIGTLVSFVRDLAPDGLSYDFALEDSLSVQANETELRQVLLNLLVNAADAQAGKGRISIRAGRRHYPPADNRLAPSAPGPFVWIEVSDEGGGVPPEIIDRIFEPFFTTKSKEAGTGLGLAVVQGMVTAWGGIVSVENRPGRGAAFTVWIPESRADSEVHTEEYS